MTERTNDTRTAPPFRAYRRAGLSVIPIATDGTKSPAGIPSWRQYHEAPPSEEACKAWESKFRGIAILGGKASGNLEIIDIDKPELAKPYLEAVRNESPALYEMLTLVKTPRRDSEGQGGCHVYYRCDAVQGNQKPAMTELLPAFGDDGTPTLDASGEQRKVPQTLIETRGQGGYVLAPGCAPECHLTRREYEHIAGPAITDIQTITPEQREILFRTARLFDRSVVEVHREPETKRLDNGERPGDVFASRAQWPDILEPHGWEQVGQTGDVTKWRRPGKSQGWSATTGIESKEGNSLLCVFSTNAHPFEGPSGGKTCSTYSKFAAYAILNHDGDFKEAARDLSGNGYGTTKVSQTCTACDDDDLIEAIDDPHRLARMIVDGGRTSDGKQTLRCWRDVWMEWNGSCYRSLSAAEIRAAVTRVAKKEFDDHARRMLAIYRRREAAGELKKDEKPPKALKVSRGLVANAIQALEGECLLPQSLEQPDWLCETPPFPADQTLPTKGGLIHLPSLAAGKLCRLKPTPAFFARHSIPYSFDPNAQCPEWLTFLSALWGDDPESISTLQEWFGLLLVPDTSHQKMAMIVGPSRSGKGTIGRIMLAMLGKENCAAPKLSSLATPFGLWPLVGKPAALVADARLSGRVDAVAVLESLLSIIGEDAQDVHRKNLPALTGIRLPTRFTVLTNELPSMRDSSGAFSARVLLFQLTEDWLGREDHSLTTKLLSELPGILNWAIRGWQRLQERGRFIQPTSGAAMLQELKDIGSPMGQFIRERCEVNPSYMVSAPDLFQEWTTWCRAAGRDNVGTIQRMGIDLRSVLPRVQSSYPRNADGKQVLHYGGIRVKSSF